MIKNKKKYCILQNINFESNHCWEQQLCRTEQICLYSESIVIYKSLWDALFFKLRANTLFNVYVFNAWLLTDNISAVPIRVTAKCLLVLRIMHDEVSETENIRKNLAIERMIVEGCEILLDTSQTFVRQGKPWHHAFILWTWKTCILVDGQGSI